MKTLLMLADGFDEIEAFTIINVLKRSNVPVDAVGVMGSMITSKSGMRIHVDKRLPQINPSEYTTIVLPGGPGYNILSKTAAINETIKRFSQAGRNIAAIGESVSILANLGLLEGKKATITPGMEKLLDYPRDQPVVIVDNLITSQGPGTALEFALAIVKKLKGDNEVLRLKKELAIHEKREY